MVVVLNHIDCFSLSWGSTNLDLMSKEAIHFIESRLASIVICEHWQTVTGKINQKQSSVRYPQSIENVMIAN
jgi:hypothetical protein